MPILVSYYVIYLYIKQFRFLVNKNPQICINNSIELSNIFVLIFHIIFSGFINILLFFFGSPFERTLQSHVEVFILISVRMALFVIQSIVIFTYIGILPFILFFLLLKYIFLTMIQPIFIFVFQRVEITS